MINYAAIALDRHVRMHRDMHQPYLPVLRAIPLTAQLAGASDSSRPSPGLSPDPRGSAVEAGRPANPDEGVQ
jgi:hypothetical protein